MTQFRFEHVYLAPDTATVFTTYFDPEHAAEEDRRAEVASREVLDLVETPSELRRVCRVRPRRRLPAVIRPIVGGDLSFDETIVWVKAADRIDFDIRPRVLRGRAHIEAHYQLTQIRPGQIRRVYEGRVTVDVPLFGARIERAVINDLGRSLAITAACTQEYLDRRDLN